MSVALGPRAGAAISAAGRGDFATRTAVIEQLTRFSKDGKDIFDMIINMWFLLVCAFTAFLTAEGAGAGAARLVCYVENAGDFAECTHLVYAGDARGEKLDSLLKEYRKNNPRVKILVRASEVDKVNIRFKVLGINQL